MTFARVCFLYFLLLVGNGEIQIFNIYSNCVAKKQNSYINTAACKYYQNSSFVVKYHSKDIFLVIYY